MYTEKTFNLPALEGLSEEQVQIHLGLYSGYVKNTNALLEKVTAMNDGGDAYAQAEVQRRLGFEFDGMRMHEYYFEQLEGGSQSLAEDSGFRRYLSDQFGSFDAYLADLKRVAGTRGIGWVVTYYDPKAQMFLNTWVGDHEFGQLAGLPIIFALDMWEHAYMVDYRPATKGSYVDTYLGLVNWSVVEGRVS